MKDFILVYDQDLEQDQLDRFLEKLEVKPDQVVTFQTYDLGSNTSDDNLLLWLSDAQAAELLAAYDESSPSLAFLPHPELKVLSQSLQVPSSKEQAFKGFQDSSQSEVIDFMTVDGKISLNSVVVGESLSILYGSLVPGFFAQLKQRFRRFFNLFRNVKLRIYQVTLGEGSEAKQLEFAAMGILAVAHCESNMIFKRLIKSTGADDGLIHILFFSPKSLFSIIRFGLQNLIFPVKGGIMPDFVSYAGRGSVKIASRDDFDFSVDGKVGKTDSLDLQIFPRKIRVFSNFEPKDSDVKNPSEIHLDMLPTGKLSEELTRKNLPWFRHATTDEFRDLFKILRENSQVNSNFLVLMSLSTLIATFGLFGNSAPVVIGAMILAPMMGPIISLAMGALRQDEFLIKNSLITIFWGVTLGLAFALIITWITPLQTLNSEIVARIRPNLLDLGIAIASGVAGAFAYSREEVSKTLAGVAISVALVPPLAVAGIGLGWGDWNVFWGSLLLLGTNLAGIVMAAVITFLTLGFSPFRLAKKGLFVSLLILLVITTPLVFSFNKMVQENRFIQQLSGKNIPHGLLREIKVIELNPLRLSVTILSDRELKDDDFKQIQAEIEEIIDQPAYLELNLGIKVPVK